MDPKQIGWKGVDWIQLAQDKTSLGYYEHSNEPSGSIKGGTFLDHLSNYQLLKDYAPWN